MENNIKELLARAKAEADSDFLNFFLKYFAIYSQLKNNYDFEIPKLRDNLKYIHYERACLGLRYGEGPPAPNDGGTTDDQMKMYYGKPVPFDIVNIFKIVENHKGLIASLGFEIYYLTEIQKLHDDVFRLKGEWKDLIAEADNAQKDIDDYNLQQELRAEQKRKEDFAKAERLKERIQYQLRAGNLSESDKGIFQKSYSNLNWNGKEHFRRVAQLEYKEVFA